MGLEPEVFSLARNRDINGLDSCEKKMPTLKNLVLFDLWTLRRNAKVDQGTLVAVLDLFIARKNDRVEVVVGGLGIVNEAGPHFLLHTSISSLQRRVAPGKDHTIEL